MDTAELDLVIFDFDGTLYDAAGMKRGLLLRELFNIRLLKAHLDARAALASQPHDPPETLMSRFFEHIGEQTGKPMDQVTRWYQDHFFDSFYRELRRRRPYAAVLSWIERLQARCVDTALWSDYGCVEARLDALSIPHSLFRHRHSSEAAGVLKPHAQPIQHLMALSGAAPERTLMVGDRDDTDGASARMAGIRYLPVTQLLNRQDPQKK